MAVLHKKMKRHTTQVKADGFTAQFFQMCWPIVGKEVVDDVIHFFTTNDLLPTFNFTIVVLVPKCSNLSYIKDFCPIFCCTVVYKCITKILANRIKKYLPAVIGKSKSSFIQGRSITDNIFMARELVRGYVRYSISSRCAIKIDLQKAFDSLNWKFLLKVLGILKFPNIFINWIKRCITSPWFSLSINGGLVGYFRGKKRN